MPEVTLDTVVADAPVTQNFDRSALESSLQTKLDAMNSDEPTPASAVESETTETAVETPAEEAAVAPAVEEATTELEAAVEPEPEAAAPAVAAATQVQTPTLPAAFRRSLKAYDWSDEEIDANLKQLGPKFIEMAQKVHTNRHAETAKWAEAGRNARQQQQTTTQADTTQQQQQFRALKPADIAALKKKYGDDGLIDELVGPINAAVAHINQMMPIVQATQANSQRAELETLGRQIEGFFGGKELEPYKELFGANGAKLSSEQDGQRQKVLETADALIAGARLQGRQVSLNDALTLALDSVSSGFKEQAVRKQITQKMVTRAKGITLLPTGKKAAASVKPGDRKALESATAARLKAAFNS